jgi:hypothetical protein
MAEFSHLSKEEIAAFDQLIEHVRADPNFITAIAVVFVRIVPIAIRVARIATPIIADIPVEKRVGILGEGPEAKLLSGKLSAHDLVEFRKTLTGGK